jgi:hypothetical protein
MEMRKDRDYHIRHRGMMENREPDTPRRSRGGAHCSCDSPCGLEAMHPVFTHLSTRPFGPDRRSGRRPCSGMTAEFTENPTLSRAYARGDSLRSFWRRSSFAFGGPAIALVRMRLAAVRLTMHRMACAICAQFRERFIMHLFIMNCTARLGDGDIPRTFRRSKLVKGFLQCVAIIFLISSHVINYTHVNYF